ncbi:hypothetical protein [Halococcus saccharolyticus]|uniref:Uncharacterized protein n=1 Tax=Halococcus saccharolyticus DSM 5350 TaxID=1227455 RepID=M0MQJ7_9EURY|nr:hypothetical protein [Halococcus saccharolyticus]EMA47911.1 hypothetical protein C449_00525 [Halococcus saccharolyticus DSM 5350]
MVHIVLQAFPVAVAVVGQATWVVTAAATLVLILLLVAFGGFVYQSVTGDGISWPDETNDDTDDEEVERGRGDDEWDYY